MTGKRPNIDILKSQAWRACKDRGHTMGSWYQEGEKKKRATNECRKCKARVQVLSHPAPNEIDIGGDAVAVNCDEKIQLTRTGP